MSRRKRRDYATWTGWKTRKIKVEPLNHRYVRWMVRLEIGDLQRFMVEFAVPHFKNHHLTSNCFNCFVDVPLCYTVLVFLVLAGYFQRDMDLSGQKGAKKTENHCHVLFKVVICGFNSLPDKPTITFGGLHQLTITSHEYPNLLWYQPIFGWRWPKPSISVQTIQGFPKVYLEKWDTFVLYNYIWYIYIYILIYIYICVYIYIYGFP